MGSQHLIRHCKPKTRRCLRKDQYMKSWTSRLALGHQFLFRKRILLASDALVRTHR